MCSLELDANFTNLDIRWLGYLGHSALTDRDIPVPDHGVIDSKTVIVPNRNAIFLAIAYSVAVTSQADMVAIGVQGGDDAPFPDCRPKFIDSFHTMQINSLDGIYIKLVTPWAPLEKWEIVELGQSLGVPFMHTWSCYKGLDKHCGRCLACITRKKAFIKADVIDPTEYTR